MEETNFFTVSNIVLMLAGGLFLIWLLSCLITVEQKTVKIIERFGKFVGVKSAGLGLRIGWIDVVAGEVDLRVMELSNNVDVKSKDNAFLNIPVNVQYKVINAEKSFYELEDSESQIMSYVFNTIRSKANEMDMNTIFQSSNEFEAVVVSTLTEKFSQYGYEIINVLVDDPQPSKQLSQAFEKVLAAKRDQEASLMEKEAIKNRIVGKAEAEAESLKLKADAYVDVRKTIATGNSESIKVFCEGLDISHSEALNYIAGLDARDTIRDASDNDGSLIIMPMEGMGNTNIPLLKTLTDAK